MTLIQTIDFGLVVLIWMVQLVVYPSFHYYQKEDLLRWHTKYTKNITYIVLPLMATQIALHSYNIWSTFNVLNSIKLVMVILTWVNTFFYAVPLHQKLNDGINVNTTCKDLVRINWFRTVLWTLVFVMGFFGH